MTRWSGAGERARGPRPAPRSGIRLALPLLSLLAAACDGARGERGGIPDSTFVEVMARLYVAPERAASSGPSLDRRFPVDSARAAVLEEFGLTTDSLLRFAERAGPDPARMAELWAAISVRVEELGGPGAGEDAGGTDTLREEAGDAAAGGRRLDPADAQRRPARAGAAPAPPPAGRPARDAGGAGARLPVARPAPEGRPGPGPGEVERDTAALRRRIERLRERAGGGRDAGGDAPDSAGGAVPAESAAAGPDGAPSAGGGP